MLCVSTLNIEVSPRTFASSVGMNEQDFLSDN